MSENYLILDLSKLIKEANEYCGFGSYEKAINKYDIALTIIEARILEIYCDTKLQEKWKVILKNLKDERADIREIIDSLETFHNVYDKNGQKLIQRPSPPKPLIIRPPPPTKHKKKTLFRISLS